MNDIRLSLLQADLARAHNRKHRPCRLHGPTRIVCNGCARIFCPSCEPACPRCHVMAPRARPGRPVGSFSLKRRSDALPAPAPPQPLEPRLRAIHASLLPLQLSALERHMDSGHWMAVIPYQLQGFDTSEQLGNHVYALIRDWAVPTPFGAGRLFKPDRWFVSFQLK